MCLLQSVSVSSSSINTLELNSANSDFVKIRMGPAIRSLMRYHLDLMVVLSNGAFFVGYTLHTSCHGYALYYNWIIKQSV